MQSDRQPRPRVTLALVSLLALATVAALIRVHPPLTPAAASRGDDLALATAWAIALAASTWLFLATGSCLVALGLARPRYARHIARTLPFGMRGIAELAIVASCIAVTALPAYAVPRGAIVLADDQPVVRQPAVAAPVVRTPRTTTAPAPHVSTAPHLPAPATAPSPSSPPTSSPRVAPTRPLPVAGSASPVARARTLPAPTVRAVPRAGSTRVVVRPGDNLWLIARARLEHVSGVRPTDAQVARYWSAVIAANRATLRSGDPSLIYPGEIVALPPARAMP